MDYAWFFTVDAASAQVAIVGSGA